MEYLEENFKENFDRAVDMLGSEEVANLLFNLLVSEFHFVREHASVAKTYDSSETRKEGFQKAFGNAFGFGLEPSVWDARDSELKNLLVLGSKTLKYGKVVQSGVDVDL